MAKNVLIRRVDESDRTAWVRMRESLWPGAHADHDAESRAYFERNLETPVVFVAEIHGQLVGFLELDFRKYAPGCDSSPVPFIEGWYVEAPERGQGVGRALIVRAESFARAAGYKEIASDVEIHNEHGIAAHAALGYEEIERVVCFRRSLDEE